MVYLIPAIIDFQTKETLQEKICNNIDAKRDGIYVLYTRNSGYLYSQIQFTHCFSSPTEVNNINHVKMREISCYT